MKPICNGPTILSSVERTLLVIKCMGKGSVKAVPLSESSTLVFKPGLRVGQGTHKNIKPNLYKVEAFYERITVNPNVFALN